MTLITYFNLLKKHLHKTNAILKRKLELILNDLYINLTLLINVHEVLNYIKVDILLIYRQSTLINHLQ